MPDFTSRSEQIEIMDDLAVSGEIIAVTLKELETINLLLGGNYVTVNGIKKLLKRNPAVKNVSIADLGCGSGDILKLINEWLTKNKYEARLTGVDANPNIVAYAKANTSPSEGITYEAVNIFSEEFSQKKFDIVTGTLFFHHFSSAQLISFLHQLREQVSVGIVINDIHRHWFAYHSIRWLTHLFSRSPMVVHDAPVSVMRAFKKHELEYIVKKAGYTHYSIKWMWAFRWQVVIYIQ